MGLRPEIIGDLKFISQSNRSSGESGQETIKISSAIPYPVSIGTECDAWRKAQRRR